LSALEEFQKSNPPITKKQTISQEQTSETPRFKRLKRPGLRDRARANKKRPDIVRQQEEGKGEERARIKSEEEYKALEKKLKGENKII
jgi:hypothetical protein